jgi:hypothetical protein
MIVIKVDAGIFAAKIMFFKLKYPLNYSDINKVIIVTSIPPDREHDIFDERI